MSAWRGALILMIGFDLGSWAMRTHHDHPLGPAPVPLTQAEVSQDWISTKVPEMIATLHFVSQEQLDSDGAPDDGTITLGVTISSQPCEIHIAAGKTINAIPSKGRAHWKEDWAGDNIAHEILHCLREEWHPAWDKILTETN